METPQQSWGDWAGSFFKPKEQAAIVSSPSGMTNDVGGRRKKTRRGGKRKSRKARRSRK